MQLAALVAHGNAALAGDAEAGVRVDAGPTFQYVREIQFEQQEGSPPATTYAGSGARGWFRHLAESGVTALWLDSRPLAVPTLAPHLLAAWANGSRASIVTEGVEPRLRWIASSSVDRAPTETDKRVWTVRCIGRPDVANLAPRPTIAEATAVLEAAARAVRDLARRIDETFWAGYLDRALARLAGDDDAATPYHDDVLPPSAELDRRRLLAGAAGAYVFGGMGTWNDTGPPPDDDEANAEYDRVTPALYSAILDAVAAAVNPRC